MKWMKLMEWRPWLAIGASGLFMASMIGCMGVGETTTASTTSASQTGAKAAEKDCGARSGEHNDVNREIDDDDADELDSDSGVVHVNDGNNVVDHELVVDIDGCDDGDVDEPGEGKSRENRGGGDSATVDVDDDDEVGDNDVNGDREQVAKVP